MSCLLVLVHTRARRLLDHAERLLRLVAASKEKRGTLPYKQTCKYPNRSYNHSRPTSKPLIMGSPNTFFHITPFSFPIVSFDQPSTSVMKGEPWRR